jgi:protein-disulfide isomerase
MDKRFLGILAAIIIVFGGIFFISQNSGSNSSKSNTNSSNGQPTKHILGEGAAGVTFQEYGDYECPVCGTYYQPIQQAVDQNKAKIYFQFSNLPLVAIHQNAFAAARAAEAAGLQGKFWQMHDKLYTNQSAWSSLSTPLDKFVDYAKELKLDTAKFKTDYASSQVNDSINADVNAFDKTNQEKATPTFFINGKYVPNSDLIDSQTGAPTAEKINQVIQNAINAQPKQ